MDLLETVLSPGDTTEVRTPDQIEVRVLEATETLLISVLLLTKEATNPEGAAHNPESVETKETPEEATKATAEEVIQAGGLKGPWMDLEVLDRTVPPEVHKELQEATGEKDLALQTEDLEARDLKETPGIPVGLNHSSMSWRLRTRP